VRRWNPVWGRTELTQSFLDSHSLYRTDSNMEARCARVVARQLAARAAAAALAGDCADVYKCLSHAVSLVFPLQLSCYYFNTPHMRR
jgi:hypothetical protein